MKRKLSRSPIVWAAACWGLAIIIYYVGLFLESGPVEAVEVPMEPWSLEEYSQPVDPMRDLTTTGRPF